MAVSVLFLKISNNNYYKYKEKYTYEGTKEKYVKSKILNFLILMPFGS